MIFKDKWVSDCGRATLYLGDCLDVLKSMPDNSIDSIISDPPYGLTGHIMRNGSNRPDIKDGKSMNKGNSTCDPLSGAWNNGEINTSSYKRILNGYSSIALFHGIRQNIEVDGFKKVDSFFIVKTTSPPRCRPGFCSSVEMCDVYSSIEGKRKWHGGFTQKNYWFGRVDSISSKTRFNHPAQKPLQAMITLVKSLTQFGETVLDPYMGSGTTGVACLRTGRRFIGIEIDEGHFATAKRRIQDELSNQAEMLQFDKAEAAV